MKKIFTVLTLWFLISSLSVLLVNANCYREELVIYQSGQSVNINNLEEACTESEELDLTESMINKMQTEMDQIKTLNDRMEWYISYKSILKKYKNIIGPPETIYDYYGKDEINLIQRAIETECYESDFESKVNVASVILNRIEDKENFGITVEDVITSPNQFSYGRKNISQETKLALEYAFEIEDTTDGCLFFHSNKKTDTFYGAKYVFTDYSGHHFYRNEGKEVKSNE